MKQILILMMMLFAALTILLYLNTKEIEDMTVKVEVLESRVNELTLKLTSGETNVYKKIKHIKRCIELREKE